MHNNRENLRNIKLLYYFSISRNPALMATITVLKGISTGPVAGNNSTP